MKRIACILLTIFMVALTGCGANKVSKWTVEDFYVYDLEGNVVDIPYDESLSYYGWEEEDYNRQTLRGIKIGSVAQVDLFKYDLAGFYLGFFNSDGWPLQDDKEKQLAQEVKTKYPDVREAIKHSSEYRNDLQFFISAFFEVQEDGSVKKLELKENGNPINSSDNCEHYYISFTVADDKVVDWSVKHYSSDHWSYR